MTDGQYKRLEAQFNEGILLGVQAATGKRVGNKFTRTV